MPRARVSATVRLDYRRHRQRPELLRVDCRHCRVNMRRQLDSATATAALLITCITITSFLHTGESDEAAVTYDQRATRVWYDVVYTLYT